MCRLVLLRGNVEHGQRIIIFFLVIFDLLEFLHVSLWSYLFAVLFVNLRSAFLECPLFTSTRLHLEFALD